MEDQCSKNKSLIQRITLDFILAEATSKSGLGTNKIIAFIASLDEKDWSRLFMRHKVVKLTRFGRVVVKLSFDKHRKVTAIHLSR